MADSAFARLKAGLSGPTLPKPTRAQAAEQVTEAQGRSRPAWAEIDLAAVRHNAVVLSQLVKPSLLVAVVKANAYGHGAPAVAKAALSGGAAGLAVALVDEGVELRQHDVLGPILLLSECGPDAVDTALSYGLTPTLYSREGIEQFARAARDLGQRTSVHVKVDTGMHRVGANPAAVRELIDIIEADPLLRLEGLWTHLAVADGESEEDRAFTRNQLAAFDATVAQLHDQGIDPVVLHAANTAGAIAYPNARYGLVRSGIGLYGYPPGPAVRAALAAAAPTAVLEPVLSLKAQVVSLRTLDAGERPSYGRRRPLPGRSVVATVPIGYADGVPRALFNQGYGVLIRGKRRPLAGVVTMDQLVIDCGDDPSVEIGDEVVLLGRQGDEVITAEDWATMLGTISYEVLCAIGPRVPRLTINGPERDGPNVSPPST